MWKERPNFLGETDEEVATRRTTSLGGVAITLLLLVLSLPVIHGLQAADSIEVPHDPWQVNRDLALHDTWPRSATPDWIRDTLRSVRQSNS